MRTIELQWDDAKWNAPIAESMIANVLDALRDEGRTLPDKWSVRGPLIARPDDPDTVAREFEPMQWRRSSLLDAAARGLTEDQKETR